MFYLLKNLPYLNLVILTLKCNNLFFIEILILYASYVCLMHSRFIKNHPICILEDGPLISEVVLSHLSKILQPTYGTSSFFGTDHVIMATTAMGHRHSRPIDPSLG
jgi:hypothetical protein